MNLDEQVRRWSGWLLLDVMTIAPDSPDQFARALDAGVAPPSERRTLNRTVVRESQQIGDSGDSGSEVATSAQPRSHRADQNRDIGREARVRVTIKDLRNHLQSSALADCLTERRAIADQIAILEWFSRNTMLQDHSGGFS